MRTAGGSIRSTGAAFPEDMLRVYRMDLPSKAGDDDTIAAPLDWLGVNYYTPSAVADDPETDACRIALDLSGVRLVRFGGAGYRCRWRTSR